MRWTVCISSCIPSVTGGTSSLPFPFLKVFSLSILAAVAALALFTRYQTTSVSAFSPAAVPADVLYRCRVQVCAYDGLELRRVKEMHRRDVDVLQTMVGGLS